MKRGPVQRAVRAAEGRTPGIKAGGNSGAGPGLQPLQDVVPNVLWRRVATGALGTASPPVDRSLETAAATAAASLPAVLPPGLVGRSSAGPGHSPASGGDPMPDRTRALFESWMGQDFADVRLHAGPDAHLLNEGFGSRAFTFGSSIYFRKGELQPATAQGRQLLAHELAHVVQQRPALPAAEVGSGAGTGVPRAEGAPLAVRCAPAPRMLAGDEPDTRDEATTDEVLVSDIAAACHGVLHAAAAAEEPWTDAAWLDQAGTAIRARVPEISDEELAAVRAALLPAVEMREPLSATGESLGIVAGLNRLARLRETGSAAVAVLAYSMARNLGYLVVQGIAGRTAGAGDTGLGAVQPVPHPMGLQPMDAVWADLSRTLNALDDPIENMRLELEGTVALLLDRRRAFAGAGDVGTRARLGEEIGTYSRQALMLNEALQRLESSDPGGGDADTALDRAVLDVQPEIEAIATRAGGNEGQAMESLGDRLTLLTEQPVAVPRPEFPELLEELRTAIDVPPESGTTVRPEEAFPIATDTAVDEMMASLADRLEAQRQDVARLRAAVIPASPEYTVPEFAQVFRRWSAFFSVEQENQDPILQMWMSMLGEPYRLMGSAALGAHPNQALSMMSTMEGAFARHLLLNLAIENLDQWWPLADPYRTGTGRSITRARRGVESTSGTALEVDYRFGHLYPGGFPASTEGERESRQRRSVAERQSTASAFSAVAMLPPPFQREAAVHARIAPDAGVPLLGLRRVEAREGWSFLVDVYDPERLLMDEPALVAREQKVIPTEVVDYLLAAQQHRATLAQQHQPSAQGRPLGDVGTRAGGLEQGTGTSVATYLEGETRPAPSEDARRLAEVRGSAVEQMRRWHMLAEDRRRGPRPAYIARLDTLDRYMEGNDPTEALVGDLERYLDTYFQQEAMTQAENRVVTVLVIASIQFGAAAQAAQIVDPGRIAEAMREAFRISGTAALLASFGSLGQVLSRGYKAFLATQGVCDLAAVQSLVSFLLIAAEADTLHKARMRARIVPLVLGDVQELVDSLASAPVSHAVESMAHRLQNPPRTPRDLADFCRPMLDDPAARAALLEGVEARLRELEIREPDPLQRSEEHRALRAFQEQLAGHARGESVLSGPDADLPLRRDVARVEEHGRLLSGRTQAERAALVEALGPHRDLPLLENPDLGNAVRIHYRDGELFVEVGPRAEPRHVRAHQETIHQVKRYQGFMGQLRRLRDRVLALVRIRQAPAHGTQGYEARLEVDKLQQMIWDLERLESQVEQRAGRLSGDEAHARSRQEQAAIARELAGLQRQLAEFQRLVDSAEAGRGFVASGDTTGRDVAARLRQAEAAVQSQETRVGEARDVLRTRQEAVRDAQRPVDAARAQVAQAMEFMTAFPDADPAFRQEIEREVALARDALRSAEASLRQAREAAALQRRLIEAEELRLHEARSAEVEVAREHLELQMSDLFRERRIAFAAMREARAEAEQLRPQLERAQMELQTALQAERRAAPPDIRGLSDAQARAVYQAREDARQRLLRPLQERVDQLRAQHDAANRRQQEARQQHQQATETIQRQTLDFERRKAAAAGITPERYDYLRSRTPDSARQAVAQRAATDAIYGTPIQGTPQADHIVSMFEIVRMPGFNRLTVDQQVAILNDPANFWALDPRVNASKGHRSLRTWRGHPDAASFPPIADAEFDRLVAREEAAREHVRNRIAALAQIPATPLTESQP